MATRTETAIQTIAPQTRQAVGVNTYVETHADPNAGQGLMQIAQALGIVQDKVAKTAAQKKAENEAAYAQNIDYYANSFMNDHTNGLVDATQVGRAFPGASPIVAGKITSLIGENWANEYTRSKFDEFLQNNPSARTDPAAQQQFFNSIRAEIAAKTEGNPFYGAGAISKANSIINEYEGNLGREAATYHQGLQEEGFAADAVNALKGQPVSGPAPLAAPAATTEFLKTKLVDPNKVSDVAEMAPSLATPLAALFQAAPPEIAAQLKITSGTRSIARQKVLWEAALKKYGSEAAARKWVAPPGKSRHNHGEAADLNYGSKEAKQWVHDNAAQFGLTFPLGNEDWHIEPIGARDGKKAPAAAADYKAGIDPATSPTALLDLIGKGESEGMYGAIYGNIRPSDISLTSMTVNEVLDYQTKMVAGGSPSSAVGKYQVLQKTLRGAMKTLGLTGDETFDPGLQDKIALHLLKQRGYDDFASGKITASQFQDNLSKEWASLPKSSGGGYYAGQAPRVDGNALRVAMSTVGAAPDGIAALDAKWGAQSSIPPARRRELIVTNAIQLALTNKDATILDRLPADFIAIPEIGLKVQQARDQVAQLTWDNWNHTRQVEEFNRKQDIEKGKITILQDLQAGKLDPTQYASNPDLYDYAKQVRLDEFTPPAVSASNRTALEFRLMQFGTAGFPDDAPGSNDAERMINMINSATGLTAADRTAMLGMVDTLLQGTNLVNDPQADANYQNTVGIGVQAWASTLVGGLEKDLGALTRKFGGNPAVLARQIYDSTYQQLVLDAIRDGNFPLSGADKRAFLKEASDAANTAFDRMTAKTEGATTAPAPAPTLAPAPAPAIDTSQLPSADQILEDPELAKTLSPEQLSAIMSGM